MLAPELPQAPRRQELETRGGTWPEQGTGRNGTPNFSGAELDTQLFQRAVESRFGRHLIDALRILMGVHNFLMGVHNFLQ